MIKATIQNNQYCTEMTFPCTETELSEKNSQIGINKDHLSPTGTVIDIEPAELSVLTDCEVSLDALNCLGKRMDGMDQLEQKQFLAVLSCDDLNINRGLKNIINLTYNLARFTLIEDTDAPEKIGLTHMLNIRSALSEAEYSDYDWLADALSSADEGITSKIQNALHQLVLNQAVTALKRALGEWLSILLSGNAGRGINSKKMPSQCSDEHREGDNLLYAKSLAKHKAFLCRHLDKLEFSITHM